MPELNPIQELVGFALEHIDDPKVPKARKIRLLRAAALSVVKEQESTALFALASALESAEKKQNELRLIFQLNSDATDSAQPDGEAGLS